MANLALDTHEFITDLTDAGMKADQAKVLVKHIKSAQGDSLTRDDVREIVEHAIELSNSKLWNKMLAMQIVLTVALAGVVVAANFALS